MLVVLTRDREYRGSSHVHIVGVGAASLVKGSVVGSIYKPADNYQDRSLPPPPPQPQLPVGVVCRNVTSVTFVAWEGFVLV